MRHGGDTKFIVSYFYSVKTQLQAAEKLSEDQCRLLDPLVFLLGSRLNFAQVQVLWRVTPKNILEYSV